MDTSVLSVLVIDDEPSILHAIRVSLRTTGWKLLLTEKAIDGLELARTMQPDVILCDAMMPILSGTQLIYRLKGDRATAKIPIVLMTGVSDPDAFKQVPWSFFLEKPFGPAELRTAIESAARQSESTVKY
jgi:CheY-like chemotaxis protein